METPTQNFNNHYQLIAIMKDGGTYTKRFFNMTDARRHAEKYRDSAYRITILREMTDLMWSSDNA